MDIWKEERANISGAICLMFTFAHTCFVFPSGILGDLYTLSLKDVAFDGCWQNIKKTLKTNKNSLLKTGQVDPVNSKPNLSSHIDSVVLNRQSTEAKHNWVRVVSGWEALWEN